MPRLPPRSPPHSPLSSLRHFRDRFLWTRLLLELEVQPLAVLGLGVLVRRVLELEGLAQVALALGVLELEVLALEVLVLGELGLEVLALEVLVLGVLELEVLALEVLVLGVPVLEALALEVLVLGGSGAGGAGIGGAGYEETVAGDTGSAESTPPPHRHDTLGPAGAAAAAAVATATAAAAAVAAAAAAAAAADSTAAAATTAAPSGAAVVPTPFGPTFPPPDASPTVWSSPPLQSPPPGVSHSRVRPCPAHARHSSPVTDLRTALLCSSLRRPPPESVLPSPPPSSLPFPPTPVTDYYRAARPVVSRVLATLVTASLFHLSSVSALTAAVAEFAAASRLDYTTCVVPAPPSRPLSVGAASPSVCAMLLSPEGDPDALDIPTPRTYREAVSGAWASQWKSAMASGLASRRSTGTYVDAVPPPRANVVDGMWLFKVKRPPGSPPVFKARYVARGFSQCEGVDLFQTFAPTPKMTTLRVLLHVAAHRDYELHSLDFSTMFLQGRLREEIWLRRPPGFTDTFPPGIQWSLRRPVYGLRQSPREWHDTLRSTRCDLRLTGPFPDEPFESSGPYTELVGCLMYLMTCTRPDLAFPLSILSRFVVTGKHRPVHWTAAVRVVKYLATTSGMGLVLGGTQPVALTGHCDSSYAHDVETQCSTQGYCFSLGAGAVSWRSTRSSSVATSRAKAEIYAGAMAAHELRWLTFLLADLGERPRSAPTLYADNKAMILLCPEP
ncbi:unnamed protein product [Closterium sp. NIES-64]|nr:unnamed protein product [Closterium sp. NIES-64]